MFSLTGPHVTDDDLAVLTAYASAEAEAESARRSRGDSPVPASAPADNAEAAAHDEGADAEGITSRSAKVRQSVWVPRINAVDGVSCDRLVPIHGRMIAHGLLQFQLLGQNDGIVYRLTSEGRNVLVQPLSEATDALHPDAA